jgi:hypothetical protein
MDERSGSLFSYVDIEARVPAGHSLRRIRNLTKVSGARGTTGIESICAACSYFIPLSPMDRRTFSAVLVLV